MKKQLLVLAIVSLAASNLFAQYSDLVSLTSSNWSIDVDNSSGPYSQTSSGLVWSGSVDQTSIASGAFVATQNWSSYNFGSLSNSTTAFAVKITGSIAKSFDITLGDNAFKFLTLSGSANNADVNGYVPLAFSSMDLGFSKSNITSYTWTWSNPSQSVNITNSAIAAIPEPSTYALMAIGGLVVFFMVRRRKVQA